MNCKRFEELAAGHALGVLGHEEAAQLQLLIGHDADARKEVATFIDAAAAIAAAALPRVVPSEELRARILAKVATTPQVRPRLVQAPTTEGYRFLLNTPAGWKDTGASGVRAKLLSRGPQPGYKVMLIALAPGAKLPDHDHVGTEELFMLSGHLQTEGQVMGPGDFLRADAGTHHHELVSPDGCVALLINGPVSAT